MYVGQFAIYQLKSLPENRAIRFRPYQELRDKGIKVQCGNNEQMYLGMMRPGDTPADIRSRFQKKRPKNFTGHSISTGDVFVLNRPGRVDCYYVEKEGFTEITGFFPATSLGTAVTIQTEHLEVDGVTNGFDETAREQIREYLKPPAECDREMGKDRLPRKTWQK